jgi:hypothetical protein
VVKISKAVYNILQGGVAMFKFTRKIIAMALGLILAVSMAGVAMADVTSDQMQAIKDWHQQRLAQKAEVLDSYVDVGKITPEQKQAVLNRMEENFAAREAAGFEDCRGIQPDGTFQPMGPGKGMGMGAGQERCYGKGFCGGMRGSGIGQGNNQ